MFKNISKSVFHLWSVETVVRTQCYSNLSVYNVKVTFGDRLQQPFSFISF